MNPMEMRLEQSQLLLTGGMTQTVFPETEDLLHETDYQSALAFVSTRKDMNRYHSMMDFLFCEIFIEYRAGCFAYYEEDGKPMLKDILSEEAVARYDRWLTAALKLALQKFQEKRALSWTLYRVQVLRLAA
jgi:hypothetical protein